MKWGIVVAIMVGSTLIAAGNLFIGRYQISAYGTGAQNGGTFGVFRLDKWNGHVALCENVYYDTSTKYSVSGHSEIVCPENENPQR